MFKKSLFGGVIILFILSCVLSITEATVKEKCSKQEDLLLRCPMALPVLSSPDISFALTREELEKSCVELRAGIRCIDNYTEVCMEKQDQELFKQIYAGITAVIQELCTRGQYQDEYLKHANCVKNVRSDYEICSKNYEVTLTSLSSQGHEDQYQNQYKMEKDMAARTVCCSFQEYLQCSEMTVQRSCGDDAAHFTSAFLKRMASNIIKSFCLEYRDQECNLAGKATNIEKSVVIFGVAILLQIAIGYSSLNLFQT